eukprot:1139503-Prymnesium_polylepis.1
MAPCPSLGWNEREATPVVDLEEGKLDPQRVVRLERGEVLLDVCPRSEYVETAKTRSERAAVGGEIVARRARPARRLLSSLPSVRARSTYDSPTCRSRPAIFDGSGCPVTRGRRRGWRRRHRSHRRNVHVLHAPPLVSPINVRCDADDCRVCIMSHVGINLVRPIGTLSPEARCAAARIRLSITQLESMAPGRVTVDQDERLVCHGAKTRTVSEDVAVSGAACMPRPSHASTCVRRRRVSSSRIAHRYSRNRS